MKKLAIKIVFVIKQFAVKTYTALIKGINNFDKKAGIILLRRSWRREYLKKTGSLELSSEQKEKIRSKYGKYYKRPMKYDDIYHRFYCEKTGIFSEDYIPDDLYYCVIDPFFNDWDEAKIIDNKCLYSKLFPIAIQPETIVCRMNSIWTDTDNRLITEEELQNLLASSGEIVIKEAAESLGGHGVSFTDKFEDALEAIKNIQGDIVIQKAIKQHEELNRLNASSVNTIRIISLIRNNTVKIYSSVLRMGIDGSRVDNASNGGITCGICDDGRLKPVAYSQKGEKFYEHPTSKVKFDDIVIPSFVDAKEMVQKLHPFLPKFRLVSWDVAVNENGELVLVEANLCGGGLGTHQLNNGPLFGDDLDEILKEVFGF